MDATVFPVVSFRDTPIQEVIDWVAHRSADHSPRRLPMGTVLKRREEPQPTITLSLRAATLPRILDAICSQVGYAWGVETYGLAIVPAESLPASKLK
jgi:hypothetical protein